MRAGIGDRRREQLGRRASTAPAVNPPWPHTGRPVGAGRTSSRSPGRWGLPRGQSRIARVLAQARGCPRPPTAQPRSAARVSQAHACSHRRDRVCRGVGRCSCSARLTPCLLPATHQEGAAHAVAQLPADVQLTPAVGQLPVLGGPRPRARSSGGGSCEGRPCEWPCCPPGPRGMPRGLEDVPCS